MTSPQAEPLPCANLDALLDNEYAATHGETLVHLSGMTSRIKRVEAARAELRQLRQRAATLQARLDFYEPQMRARLIDRTKPGPNGCQEWTGDKNRYGYGKLRFFKDGPCLLAHRVIWQVEHGLIPAGLCVLHRCDNPPCVNLDHLFLGTVKDNVSDMIAKGRHRYSGCRGPYRRDGTTRKGVLLNPEKAKAIREEYATGRVRQKDIATKYGVEESTIRLIINGRSWRESSEGSRRSRAGGGE